MGFDDYWNFEDTKFLRLFKRRAIYWLLLISVFVLIWVIVELNLHPAFVVTWITLVLVTSIYLTYHIARYTKKKALGVITLLDYVYTDMAIYLLLAFSMFDIALVSKTNFLKPFFVSIYKLNCLESINHVPL